MTSPSQNILVLLTGKAVTDPSFVEKVTLKFQDHDTNKVHRHVLDRVASGAAKLDDSSFTKIVYIPSSADEQEAIFTTPSVLSTLHKALAPNGTLSTISISSNSSDDSTNSIVTPTMITKAIVSGFLQTKDKKSFEKSSVSLTGSTATIVRRPKNNTTNSAAPAVKIPLFKRTTDTSSTSSSISNKQSTDQISSRVVKLSLDDDLDNDEDETLFDAKGAISLDNDANDDLVDENELLGSIALSKPIVLPPKCDPGPGKRRKKACKDCSCGLRELELQEEEQQRKKQNAVILNLDGSPDGTDDDYAIDFTVPGVPVGSCGSCALGDAFRCDGCPYLGLPPFKPGEIINISAIKNDS